ncbi:uncharacterized protein PV07_03055 [Cladophialophora immunda]|uniref:Uncharacterized protein n=1 Tax=Cladophialophora immunda TaxID=569365 RepID=A0A0D2D6S5_9EURO|nr:uncharacterized protein PV07_03055 [Cladophialophora immunda]KIW31404.1 hypothetical protein PV07_03055 [Cladophialophora immunda]OQV08841.1 hypothetical protein CLAIMM_13056 [Cladophialophora immunda]
MGKNSSKKAARHARATQDFFNQVPESSTGDSAKTSTGASSISTPTNVADALGSFVNPANAANSRLLTGTFQAFDLRDDYRQAACLLGERIYHTFERNKEAARDLLRHLFTTAYLTVDKSTGRREWRLDTDIKYEIVEAIHSTKLIGLFTHQRPIKNSNPTRLEYVIDGPSFLDEFDVVGIIVDFFLDWSVECADFLREHPDLRSLDISLLEYRDKHLPFACIGIIEIAAAIKAGVPIDLDPRPLEFFIAVRMNKMAGEQNLFVQGKPKKVTRKNKGEGKLKATEPTATGMEHTAEGFEEKQDDKEHVTNMNATVEDAEDEDDVNNGDVATTSAAAEPAVTTMESTAEVAKDKNVNNGAITLPAAGTGAGADAGTAAVAGTTTGTPTLTPATATGLNIPVAPDSVATLIAGARALSINDSRPGSDDPYSLRTRNRHIRRTMGARGFYMNNDSTAAGDDPFNLRTRPRLPQASANYVDPFTDADAPTPTGAPVPDEDPRPRRGDRLRANTTNPGATTFTSPMTATDASGTAEYTDPPPRVRAGRRRTSGATAGSRNTSSGATAGSNNTSPPLGETAARRLAKNRLYQELQDLVNTNFPSAAARRTAFAQARQRLLRSETVAVARGEQPLRATATRATQEALTIGRDDALNAVRQQRAAEAARMRATRTGTEANARAREQGFGFDIGGMGGWYGELEAMQIQALRGKKSDGKKEGEADKKVGGDEKKDGDEAEK